MEEALGWAGFICGFAGSLVLIAERGYRDGMRFAWFIATLAVPCWFAVKFRSVTFDTVSGVALGVLIATLFRPFSGTRTRWVLSDLMIGLVVLTAFTSDTVNRALIPGTIIDVVRLWILPYLVGRLCVDSWKQMDRTVQLIVVLAAALSAFALIEAVSKTNILATLSGKKWDILDRGEGYRWGLKRAQAIANHPIYFGLLLSLTLPWLLAAARAALRREAPQWWTAVPVMAVSAAIVTVSRSAHLAILMVFLSDLFFRRATARMPMIVIAVSGGVIFFLFREQILDILGAYAGEADVGDEKVKIYGIEYDYTGTRHRDLLFLAYDEAIDRKPWFGFGTIFPSPDMPKDPYMDPRFKSIDNQYLLHYLQYGYVGIAAFIAFGAVAAWNLAREAWARDGVWSDLAAGLFGAFVAVMIMVRGVAILPDFGAMWLFVAGVAATLRARRLASRSENTVRQTAG